MQNVSRHFTAYFCKTALRQPRFQALNQISSNLDRHIDYGQRAITCLFTRWERLAQRGYVTLAGPFLK